MAINFRCDIGEIGDTPSFLGLAFHNGWQNRKGDERVNSAEVLSALCKNLVNFGPLTPEFMVMFDDHLCAKSAKSTKRVRFLRLAFDNEWQKPLNGFAQNSHGRRSDEFECQGQRSKVKGQGHQGQKRAMHSEYPRGVGGMKRPRCR